MELENIKKNQSEMKNTSQGIGSGVHEAEYPIRDLEEKDCCENEMTCVAAIPVPSTNW